MFCCYTESVPVQSFVCTSIAYLHVNSLTAYMACTFYDIIIRSIIFWSPYRAQAA